MNITNIINNTFKNKSRNHILQIGGNDGIQDDFINTFSKLPNSVSHILEPIPEYYEELERNYQNYPNVFTYNYAMTNKTGIDYINYIPFRSDMPIWLKGCSSFFDDKNVISGYSSWNEEGVPQDKFEDSKVMSYIKDNMVKLPVYCLTLKDFISKFDIQEINTLIIDTEGYECEILKQVQFGKFALDLIVLEYHNHSGIDKKTMKSILSNNGYKLSFGNLDLIAEKQ